MTRRCRCARPKVGIPSTRIIIFCCNVSVITAGVGDGLYCAYGATACTCIAEVGGVEAENLIQGGQAAGVAAFGGVVAGQGRRITVDHGACVSFAHMELKGLGGDIGDHAQRSVSGGSYRAYCDASGVVIIPIAQAVGVRIAIRGDQTRVTSRIATILLRPHPNPIAIRITVVIHERITRYLVLH